MTQSKIERNWIDVKESLPEIGQVVRCRLKSEYGEWEEIYRRGYGLNLTEPGKEKVVWYKCKSNGESVQEWGCFYPPILPFEEFLTHWRELLEHEKEEVKSDISEVCRKLANPEPPKFKVLFSEEDKS